MRKSLSVGLSIFVLATAAAGAAKMCRRPCSTDIFSSDLATNTTCMSGFANPSWTLAHSCNNNCGGTSSFRILAGKIYRFDIRSSGKAGNFLVTRKSDSYLYSFQQQCNGTADNPQFEVAS